MARRSEVLPRLPMVFGLGEVEAAVAVGISSTKFRELVTAGTMPRPRKVGGRLIYDVDELRAAFKALPHDREQPAEVDTWADVA